MKNNEYIFYDDTDITYQYNATKKALFDMYQEDYNWYSVDEVPDDLIWSEISNENNIDFNYLEHNLRKIIDGNYFIVKGTCGRWNGKQECGKFITTVSELLNGLRHLDYTKFYEKKGHFYIEGHHHDGSDFFELKKLTKKGIEYADKNFFAHDRQLHSTIFDNKCYSSPPRIYKNLYGELHG